MRRFTLLLLFALSAAAQTPLSLRDAVSQALSIHPLLSAGAGRVAASEGLRRQAALRPNPRMFFQVENLRGHGQPGFVYGRDADTYAYVSQVIETSGRRGLRTEAASANVRRAELERELLARQIAARVKHAYWSAAGAQRVHELLVESMNTFRQVVEYHELRVREGAMAEADLLRVRVESERFAIAANSAALDAERARIQLLREMGRTEFPKVQLTDKLDETGPFAGTVDAVRALEERLEVRAAKQAVEQAQTALRLERASARPNVDLLAGYKRSGGFNTVLGGVQVDLPFANRNQGNIGAAEAEVRVAEASLAAVEATVKAEVRTAQSEYEIRRRQLLDTLRTLREHAVESSKIALAAYREGGLDLLRLIDSERVRLDVEALYGRTLAEYRQSIVNLETALGVAP
ncbi:MAG TPA: TolC family protein [Bryobacteraceae bacterium]|nr:TolC family protein [Bryobacteraceae bacterium]